MASRNLIFLLFFFAKLHSYDGCSSSKNRVIIPCKEYDLNNPKILKLSDALTEISGICFYPKDSSVFAISDDNGNLYKIHLNKNFISKVWKFDKAGKDFEDVFLQDNTFYVLQSNGNVVTINFSEKGDTIFNRSSTFPGSDKKKNEFESMYYDDVYQGLIVLCKECEADKKSDVSAWTFDPSNDRYTPSQFSINVKAIAEKLGEEKLKLKPSAAAINPITKDVWILASTNQLLIVTDRKGNTKEVYTLNPVIFSQPEGITFTPWGDLLISNEAADKYATANLLIFPPKRKS